MICQAKPTIIFYLDYTNSTSLRSYTMIHSPHYAWHIQMYNNLTHAWGCQDRTVFSTLQIQSHQSLNKPFTVFLFLCSKSLPLSVLSQRRHPCQQQHSQPSISSLCLVSNVNYESKLCTRKVSSWDAFSSLNSYS